MIAAIGKNRELGKDNKLLWHISEDAKFFRETTTGHVNIMGRKTYESIMKSLGKPLPERTNIVVTRDKDYSVPDGVIVVSSIEEALDVAKKHENLPTGGEIFIIGGGKIYELGIKYADKLYLTLVDGEFPNADTYFPEYKEFERMVSKREGEGNGYKYTFVELMKR